MLNPRFSNQTGGMLIEQDDGIDLFVEPGTDLHARALAGEFGDVAQFVPAPEPAEAEIAASEQARIAALLEYAVQDHLDATARSRRYDSIVSACSYAGAANRFQAESVAFIQWRAAVWDHCYQVLADVQAGTRAVPTADELIAELPAFAG